MKKELVEGLHDWFDDLKKTNEAIKFAKGSFPDVDHMPGAVIRDYTPVAERVMWFANLSAWDSAAQNVNSTVHDDNAEIITSSHMREYLIDDKPFARWINSTNKGWVNTSGNISEELISEKSKSIKQARFMAAAAHDPKFAKRAGIDQAVAKEFNDADKGTALLKKAMKESNEQLTEEQLTEELVGPPFMAYNNVKLLITKHYYDRLRYRKDHVFVRADVAEPILHKLGKVRKKMARLVPGVQFWVVDHESGIAFGLRRLSDDKDGNQVNVVGTVVTPCKDGRPGLPNGDLNPTINLA